MAASDDSRTGLTNRKLARTLGELESALAAWDSLQEPSAAGDREEKTLLPESSRSQKADEMRKKAQALLRELKTQIDDLDRR